MKIMITAAIVAATLAGAGAIAAEKTTAPTGCTGFRFNLDRELQLFSGGAQAIAAAGAASNVIEAQFDRLYEVALQPQANVQFARDPGKLTVADGSYAGLLRFTPSADGTLTVTLSEAAWVDVLASGQLQQSVAHTGSAGCSVLHKSVQFTVKKNQPLVLQISGSTIEKVRVALTLR